MVIFGEKETDIIENIQLLCSYGISQIALIPSQSDELEDILGTICDQKKWEKWTDSSGKSDSPPDFYSDEYKLMMDVMRVNDHEQKGKKGKLHNPSMAHEREMYKELEQAGITTMFPAAKVFLNGNTQLPTYADHNYNLYLKCFKRVVSKHIDSIPLYRLNHPEYKVIFLVYDESTAYFESTDPIDTKKQLIKGEWMAGQPHYFFIDQAFLEVFMNKGIDYLFWFAPYKMFEKITPPIEMPSLCIYDLSKKFEYGRKYDSSKMTSVEV